MGLFKEIGHKWNGIPTNPPRTEKSQVNQKSYNNNGNRTYENSSQTNQERQKQAEIKNKSKQLPNSGPSRTQSNGMTSQTTSAPMLPARRPIGPIQGAGIETGPSVVRVPTAQNLKERSHDLPERPTEEPPQLDTIVPGPLLRKETVLDTSSVHDDLISKLGGLRDRERELEEDVKQKTTRIHDQQLHIQELERHVQSVLGGQNECNSRIANLEQQLREEQEQSAKFSQAWKRSTAALSQAQRQDANYKIDDKAMQGLYEELIFDVANWADNHRVSDMKQLPDSDIEVFLSLTHVPEQYMHHKRTQTYLLKSLVMQMLVEDIFTVASKKNGNTGLWWAGECAPALRSIYTTLLPAEAYEIPGLLKKGPVRPADVKEFSQWKARSALLLSQCAKASFVDANINMLVTDWKTTLIPFVKRVEAGAWRELGDIVRKAINLDLEMNKSRALFAVRQWSAEGINKLDPATIETAVGFEAARPGMTAEIVVAPSLTKTGNADGDAFDTMSYISKWVVVCAENRENMKKPKKGSEHQ